MEMRILRGNLVQKEISSEVVGKPLKVFTKLFAPYQIISSKKILQLISQVGGIGFSVQNILPVSSHEPSETVK